nr:PREDICTED: protein D1-like isoform X2 [Bemisia tabaci]
MRLRTVKSKRTGILWLKSKNMVLEDNGLDTCGSRRIGASRNNLMVSVALLIGLESILRTLAETITTTHGPLHDDVKDSNGYEDFEWNKNLIDSKIIPDVIPQAVQFNLKILFGNEEIKYGNLLVPSTVKEEPTLLEWPSDMHKYYSIVMTDADNPEPEDNIHAEWVHWVVMDVQGGNRNVCRIVVPYQKPQQNDFRKLKGMHRYVIAVYEQPHANVTFHMPVLDDEPPHADRAHFSSKYFVKRHKMQPACAANFFRIDWG